MGQQAVVALPQNIDGRTGYDMKLLEARDRGWESFVNTIDRCDKSIVLPILGQNLTTEVKEGSFAAARQHGDIRQDYLEFDNATLSECIYRDIARPWSYFNYGSPINAHRTNWDVEPIEDYAGMADVWLKFTQGANYLRQAGWEVRDIGRQAEAMGLRIRAKQAAPAQVAAKQAQSGETVQELVKALAQTHQLYERLDAELARAA
jgi:phage gp29-like protein